VPQRESVNVTYPRPNQTLSNTLVTVAGDCTTPGMTVAVQITTGTVTVGSVHTVVAGSPTPTWSASSWTLSSQQNYTASAWKASDPSISSGNVPFKEA
jgi:hypothetical protein